MNWRLSLKNENVKQNMRFGSDQFRKFVKVNFFTLDVEGRCVA